jgi:hypothetical protein
LTNLSEVGIGKGDERVNAVQQSLPRILGSNPSPVGVGYFVVEPDERAPGCLSGEERRLPVQPMLGLAVFRELDDGQLRQTESRSDEVVRVRHPGRRPDQPASQGQQPAPVRRVEPTQQRITRRITGWGKSRRRSRSSRTTVSLSWGRAGVRSLVRSDHDLEQRRSGAGDGPPERRQDRQQALRLRPDQPGRSQRAPRPSSPGSSPRATYPTRLSSSMRPNPGATSRHGPTGVIRRRRTNRDMNPDRGIDWAAAASAADPPCMR